MKEAYRNLFDQVTPPADFQEKVLARLEPKKRKRRIPRPLGAVAAVLVVILLATPVMAAYVPPINDLMYAISPEIAARFSPVQESCEANGIRMEVVATSVHGNEIELYLGFTDLEGQGRIDLNTCPDMVRFTGITLLARVSFGNFSGGGVTEAMRYDPETDTYYSLTDRNLKFYSKWKKRYLTVRELYGDRVTATVDHLYRYVDTGEVTLPVILRDQETMVIERTEEEGLTTYDMPGARFFVFGLSGEEAWMYGEESFRVMKPGKPIQNITKDFAVTGMTYLDGTLHLQIRSERKTSEEPVTPLYELRFEDGKGNEITCGREVCFDIEEDGKRIEYEEIYFDIPEDELGNYTLVCELSEHQIIKGPWQVTFPLVENEDVGEREDGGPYIVEETMVVG